MFGFLKKKLQEAVSKFSKGAKEEVVEEKIDDAEQIEEAKAEEKKILPKKTVREIPERPAERAKHQHELLEKEVVSADAPTAAPKAEPAPVAKPVPVLAPKSVVKPEPKATTERAASPPVSKPEQRPVRTPAPLPLSTPVPERAPEVKRKESPVAADPVVKQAAASAAEPSTGGPKTSVPERQPEKKAEKAGFLSSLFKKKTDENVPEKPAPAKVVPGHKAKSLPERSVSEEKVPVTVHDVKVAVPEMRTVPGPVATPVVEKKSSLAESQPAAAAQAEEDVPRSFLGKLKEAFTKKTLSEEKFEELFWELEVTLLENNVALEVIEKLKADLKAALTAGKVSRLGIEDLVLLSLRQSVEEVLSIPGFDLVERIKSEQKRPYVIAFIGVNGSGKTTTLAKVANLFQVEGLSVVMAASDTFRAAAIDQLKEHADKLNIKLISQGYGADPAAVAFDAIEHAKAKNLDVVMIDTAGRLHSNTNLMAELQKVVRVSKPDLKIFIGESITGNDCVEQAKEFDRLVGIDAIILSKADVDEKGGAALSVSYVTKKPILYLGVGQAYGDLKEFDKEEIIKGLGL